MTPQHQIVKFEPVKVWVTRLPSLSHPPLSMWRHRVTCLPPKNASAPWGGVDSRWLTIIMWQVSYIQYLLACQKSQRSTPYNIVKCGLPWKRVFRRRHLGRRVTAVTCLRWPTVVSEWLITLISFIEQCQFPHPFPLEDAANTRTLDEFSPHKDNTNLQVTINFKKIDLKINNNNRTTCHWRWHLYISLHCF